MKRKVLEEISNGKYSVVDKSIYEGKTKICNFYIKEFTKNRNIEDEISFTITLKSTEEKREATIPICYLNEPSGWIYYGFDSYDFEICVSNEKFDSCINEIIRLIEKAGLCGAEEYRVGWDFSKINPNTENDFGEITFGKIDDPTEVIRSNDTDKKTDEQKEKIEEKKKFFRDYLLTFLKHVDRNISVPLFSYMLLALLGSFDLLGDNVRPDFIMAITGNTAANRRKTALFFTNLFKRSLYLQKSAYKFFHITNQDSLSEMRFKAEYAKDCVLIAFEPNKKQLNYLIDEVYGNASIDENRPVRSMCLVTTQEIENVKGNVINICLPETYNFKDVGNFAEDDYPTSKQDELVDSIYYYIHTLLNKMMKDKEYIIRKFKKFNEWFKTNISDADFCEESYEIAMLLSFSYALYMGAMGGNAFEGNTIEEICNTVESAFVIKGTTKNIDFVKTCKLCSEIDTFFTKIKNKDLIGKIGDVDVNEKRLWYDEEYMYIRAIRIQELLEINKSKERFSMNIKRTLAEKQLIKTYIKSDGKVEYTVHMQKPLYADKKSTHRFIAFNREECRKHNLFENLEKIFV